MIFSVPGKNIIRKSCQREFLQECRLAHALSTTNIDTTNIPMGSLLASLYMVATKTLHKWSASVTLICNLGLYFFKSIEGCFFKTNQNKENMQLE